MMRFKTILIFLLMISATAEISAQEKKWSLEECIDYALSNNLGLQRQRLLTETADVNYLQSKMAVLPSLNMGTNASVNFGRSEDPQTSIITNKKNLSNEYSLSSEINLFSGLTTLNTISANKFMYKAGLEAEKIARNTLIVNILGQYYQVLYARGLENAARMQLDLSEAQVFRITKMVETGREALSKQYEIESTASADRLKYTSAHNSAVQAVTTLRQTLQIDPAEQFDILIPDLNNMLIIDSQYNSDSIYQIASEVLPRLKEITYELQAAKKQVAVAKGNIAPSITAGGVVYTGYYTFLNDSTDFSAFSGQIKDNNSQAVYLTVNIPIFNNYVHGRAIKLAKIKKNDTELRLQLEKNSLFTDIENACLSYNSGRDEYMAAKSNLEFNKKSFYTVEKKFETGLVEVTDYSAAKTSLFVAESEALRTKLQLLVRKLTIQLYTTGEYKNITIF
jgi:outer membrane protein